MASYFNSTGNKGKKKGLRKFRTRFQGSSLPSACVGCASWIRESWRDSVMSYNWLSDTPGLWFPGGILEPIHPRAQREGCIDCAVGHRLHRTMPATALTRTGHEAPPTWDGPRWARAWALDHIIRTQCLTCYLEPLSLSILHFPKPVWPSPTKVLRTAPVSWDRGEDYELT